MLFLLLIGAFAMWAFYKSAKFCLFCALFYVFVLGSPGCKHRRYEAHEGPPAIEAVDLPESRDDPNDVLRLTGPLAHERGW